MPPNAPWLRPQRPSAPTTENTRWAIVVVVLIGSLAVYGVERWLRKSDAPIIGSAFVIDGDTIVVDSIRIRLLGIDAPELDQSCNDLQGRTWSCGLQAATALRATTRGHDLTCLPHSKDKFGRMLAVCTLPDKTDVNAWMVQQGWAISYDYADTYGAQQIEAKAAKRGVWSGPFTMPREWRQQHPRSDGDRKD
ncbi:MAG: thermonuclease family protein [Afipia sp.]|nr:thermonuclease family protein [Afipia sp.]